jgi:hypothetical protein
MGIAQPQPTKETNPVRTLEVKRMFSGFKSRCTTRWVSCMYAIVWKKIRSKSRALDKRRRARVRYVTRGRVWWIEGQQGREP